MPHKIKLFTLAVQRGRKGANMDEFWPLFRKSLNEHNEQIERFLNFEDDEEEKTDEL